MQGRCIHGSRVPFGTLAGWLKRPDDCGAGDHEHESRI